jgi:hypothetical protein
MGVAGSVPIDYETTPTPYHSDLNGVYLGRIEGYAVTLRSGTHVNSLLRSSSLFREDH